MITIDFNLFYFDQNEKKESCIDFIKNIVGVPDKITIAKENGQDPRSEYSLLFRYNMFSIKSFDHYDELMDFARKNELYVVVYDHIEKERKGVWYDEDDRWITQKLEIERYEQ